VADEKTSRRSAACRPAWPFLWYFVRRYYLHRYMLMVLAVLLGQGWRRSSPMC